MNDDEGARLRRQRLERLRKLGVQRGARDLARPAEPKQVPGAGDLPGESVDTPFGQAWVRVVRYPLSQRPELVELADAKPEAIAALGQDQDLLALVPARAAFIDTETTGLSLGAGTYTFLIGIGTYEFREGDAETRSLPESGLLKGVGEFVVRQCFMRNPGEERAQLHLVEEILGNCTGVISFNGRAFDLPLIQNRFVLARMPFALAHAPHLDLLPPARRIWRALHGSCSLGSLERNVLDYQRTAQDVPGWMIPDIYREYYRTGVPSEMLARVFYHNLEDITSMTVLAARMLRLFRTSHLETELARLHPLECLSLARCYEHLGWGNASVTAYRTVLNSSGDDDRIHAMRGLGFLYKKLGLRDDAAALWEEWIGTIPGNDLTPFIELAKHHEWHTQDLAAARGWTAWALRIAESWPAGHERDDTLAQLRHRLVRLERKLAGISAEVGPEE